MKSFPLIVWLALAGAASTPSVDSFGADRASPTSRAPAAPIDMDMRAGAYRTYSAAVLKDLLASSDPRMLALAAMAMPTMDEREKPLPTAEKNRLYVRAAAMAPHDALVQWIAAGWQLATRDNDHAATTIATLTRIEPDNAAAWVLALNLASQRSDKDGFDAAFAHIASSTRSDEHLIDLLRAWMAVYDAHPAPAILFDTPADADAASFELAMSYAAAFALPAYASLMSACKQDESADPERVRRCGAAGRLMADHSTSLAGRSIGAALLRSSGAGDEERRDATWISFHLGQAIGFDVGDSLAMQAYIADWRNIDDELEIARRALRRAGVSESAPPGWSPPNVTVP